MGGLAVSIVDEDANASPSTPCSARKDPFMLEEDHLKQTSPIAVNVVWEGRTLSGERIQFKARQRAKLLRGNHLQTSERLATPFYQLLRSVEERICFEIPPERIRTNPISPVKEMQLWTDKYRPRKFTDLLAVDSNNIEVLRWVSQWRNFINRNSPNPKRARTSMRDDQGDGDILIPNTTPEKRILIMSGPPGLGKTTLAHVVAQAGDFQVVEINASDERTGDVVIGKIEAAIGSDSMLNTRRPNLVIIDEIDGALGGASEKGLLNFLVKLATTGEEVSSATEGSTVKSKKKKGPTLNRPIICICNDLYASALRPLRAVAHVVTIKKPNASNVAARLREICEFERVRVEGKALLELADLMECDMRASLHALQFITRRMDGVLTAAKLGPALAGLKDSNKSTAAVYDTIFYSNPRDRRIDPGSVLSDVIAHGEYDRLMTGVFELYLKCKFYDDTKMSKVNKALDWLAFADRCNSGSYMEHLTGYEPYPLLMAHRLFAAPVHPGFKFPRQDYEEYQRKAVNEQIMTDYRAKLAPSIRSLNDETLLERITYIIRIIAPTLRNANPQLLKGEERAKLDKIVKAMLSDGLFYRQVRRMDGQYDFLLEPPIDQLVHVLGGETIKPLTVIENAVRQMISAEIEATRIRLVQAKNPTARAVVASTLGRSAELQQAYSGMTTVISRPPPKTKLGERRDFFGRPIANTTPLPTTPIKSKGQIWFRFNEGFSNAVRRTITIADLLGWDNHK